MSVSYCDLPDSALTMIDTSLVLCQSLLNHTDTFYPFAAVDLDGDLQPIFSYEPCERDHHDNFINAASFEHILGEGENMGMIEQLETNILNCTLNVSKANSVLMYAGFIETKRNEFTDVIVADVNLFDGSSHQFYFPVIKQLDHVTIGTPFTHLQL